MLLLLVVAAAGIVYLVTPLEPDFAVGKCVSGYWSDDGNSELTGVASCAEPHDYEVIALSEDWAGCPPKTVARVPYSAHRMGGLAHYMCLAAAP